MEFRYRTFLILIILKCTTSQILYDITAMTGYILIGSEVRNISNKVIKECNFSENVYRLVIDLHARNYVHGVYMSFNSTANITMVGYDSNLAVDGNYRCTKSGGLALYFRCEHVMKVLVIEGLLNCYSLRLEGYDPHLDQILGCFKKRSMDMYTDCYPVCTTIYMGYTSYKCLCTNSLIGMPIMDTAHCFTNCHHNPYILCGKDLRYVTMYIKDIISIYAKVPTHATSLYNLIPQKCEGRSGVNCEMIDCENNITSTSCYPNMNCIKGSVLDHIYSLCQCHPSGFYRKNVVECQDIDECGKTQRHTLCNLTVSTCVNTIGSYFCSCFEGMVPYIGHTCIDLIQCSRLICKNYPCEKKDISYVCVCPSGFQFVKDLSEPCRDFDECSTTSTRLCDPNSTNCANNPGSYTCECLSGYIRLNTLKCSDVDECATINICDRRGSCTNTIGSYECQCLDGTQKRDYQHEFECEDIDECKEVNLCDQEESFCLNLNYGYYCHCFDGYISIDNYTCQLRISNVSEKYTIDHDQTLATTQGSMTRTYLMGILYFIFGLVSLTVLGYVIFKIVLRILRYQASHGSSISTVLSIN